MKITKEYLKRVIREEITRSIEEGFDPDELDYRASQSTKSVKTLPKPHDPLEGYSIPVDYEEPKNTEYDARAAWKQFVSKGINPETQEPFRDPEAAKKEFIKRYLGSV